MLSSVTIPVLLDLPAAATRTALTEPRHLTVAFATTCFGRGNSIESNMADARKRFMETITSQRKNFPSSAESCAPNKDKADNCPELMTKEITSRKEVNTFPFVSTVAQRLVLRALLDPNVFSHESSVLLKEFVTIMAHVQDHPEYCMILKLYGEEINIQMMLWL